MSGYETLTYCCPNADDGNANPSLSVASLSSATNNNNTKN